MDAMVTVLLEADIAAPALLRAADVFLVPPTTDVDRLDVDVTVAASLSFVTVKIRDCRDSMTADDTSDEVLEPL